VIEAPPMTDYRSVLQGVLQRRPEATRETRQTIYQHARQVLESQLRAVTSPISEEEIELERSNLEAAIELVEAEFDAPDDAEPVSSQQPRSFGPSKQHAGALPPPDEDLPTADAAARSPAPRQRIATPSRVVLKTAARNLAVVQGTVRRRFEAVDPTLPIILEFQRPSTAIVNAPIPRSARLTSWLIASMIIALIAAAGLISIDRVVTAQGVVVSQSPTILVQPLETAIVRSIEVTEGQQVRAGEVLAKLDPTFAAADLGSLAAQVSSLSAEVARLQAEAGGKPFTYDGNDPDWLLQASIYGHRQAEFTLKVENYKHKLDELTSMISKGESDIEGYTKRAEVAQNVEGIRKELEARELGSRLNTLAASDARAEMQRARAGAEEILQSSKRDREALQAESGSFVQNWSADVSQKLSDALRKLSDAREQLNKAQLRRSLVELRADQDAIVQSLAKVSVGSVLQSGQPFVTLVPMDSALEVEANVAGSENGFVHPGDEVAVKFDTFPYSQYGMAEGKVRIVSPDIFTPQEEARNPTSSVPMPMSTPMQPFYRARITLDHVALHDTPPGFRVTPGMPVTADIKVGRRTVLSYFFGRVLPIAKEGMREPQS